MRYDLVASELLSQLNELYPFYSSKQMLCELYLEDALKYAASEETERCIALIRTQINKLRSRGSAYSTNAANQLQAVVEELEAERQVYRQDPDFDSGIWRE